MNATTLVDDRFLQASRLAQRPQSEGNGKGCSLPSAERMGQTQGHSGPDTKRIVREWRRVYWNLYGT
jgi:hypothetical protein